MSLAVALTLGEPLPELVWLPVILLMGFVSYGLSITLYILAQRELGAAKTSAYYAVAPFLGAGFSVVLLGERPGLLFWEALAMMALSAFLTARDTILLQHTHPHTHEHTHPHRHGELLHTHAHAHEHTHLHVHREDEARHTHTHRDLPDHDPPHASRSASASLSLPFSPVISVERPISTSFSPLGGNTFFVLYISPMICRICPIFRASPIFWKGTFFILAQGMAGNLSEGRLWQNKKRQSAEISSMDCRFFVFGALYSFTSMERMVTSVTGLS